LLEVFAREYGRVSLIARGARLDWKSGKHKSTRSRVSHFQGLLQPFIPLLLSWRGRTELMNLTSAESCGKFSLLSGQALFCGWYMNELLMRTMRHGSEQAELFDAYQKALNGLLKNPQPSLRSFEKHLLKALGVMPQLDQEAKNGRKVEPQAWYEFSPTRGVVGRALSPNPSETSIHFQGAVLLALQHDQWDYREYWPQMKRLLRLILDHVVGYQPIHSRDLFQ
jgi:DNA repair protein RecO (recombination protein O)